MADQTHLLHRAEVLGQLHALSLLCAGDTDQRWRDKMTSILNGEAGKPAAVQSLTRAFNSGYTAETAEFGSCNNASQTEAAKLASEL